MPRNATQSPQKLKQKTLTGFFSSPLAESPARKTKMKHRKTKTQTRERVETPEPQHLDVDGDDSDVGAIKFEPEVIDLSDEDESPRRPGTKRQARHVEADSDSLNEDAVTNVDSERSLSKNGKNLGRKSRRIQKRKHKENIESEDSAQPKRRRFIKGTRPPTPEEDEDIADEVEAHRIIEPRFRKRDKKTTYQQNLEKLKRKRGLTSSEPSYSTNEEDEDDEDDLNSIAPFAGAKPDNSDAEDSSHDEGTHSQEDGFIVEDDEAPVELPMEYSMNTHQDLAHHFKIICQLFVHIAVKPADQRRSFMEDTMKNNEYFSVPLQIARRKLAGLRDSLVASSVWRPDFKNQLHKYPVLELSHLDFAIPACDACHLGKRMSTLLGRVSGAPYDRLGFQPLIQGNLDSDSDDSDEVDEYEGSKAFNLGRFCAKRTQVFHRFTHWEYALFESLLREIETLQASRGGHGFVRVAFAKGRKPPKDLTDADGIMDWLDQRGIVDMQWQDVRGLMESARNLEMAAKRGEDDIDVI